MDLPFLSLRGVVKAGLLSISDLVLLADGLILRTLLYLPLIKPAKR